MSEKIELDRETLHQLTLAIRDDSEPNERLRAIAANLHHFTCNEMPIPEEERAEARAVFERLLQVEAEDSADVN